MEEVKERAAEKRGVAAAAGAGDVCFYLTEYDVDNTADHHQSIEDVPGVSYIALSGAACTARDGAWVKGQGTQGGV